MPDMHESDSNENLFFVLPQVDSGRLALVDGNWQEVVLPAEVVDISNVVSHRSVSLIFAAFHPNFPLPPPLPPSKSIGGRRKVSTM